VDLFITWEPLLIEDHPHFGIKHLIRTLLIILISAAFVFSFSNKEKFLKENSSIINMSRWPLMAVTLFIQEM